MSNKNPFRKHEPESGHPRAPSPPLPPLPPPSPPLPSLPPATPPPVPARSSTSDQAAPRDPSFASGILEVINDDLPPPYTPAANADEETVGLGPRRPFQPAPSLPSSSNVRPPPTRFAQTPPRSFYTDSGSRTGRGAAPWQTPQQYRQRPNVGGGGLIGALIDTVRDIADSVSGTHDARAGANAGAYAAPYASAGSVYAPPPGPPPPTTRGPPAPAPMPHRPASTPPAIADDGSPTETPVPGHPLLRHGQLLVYPRDHLCVKCKNTGYKDYDPSHACHKCWDKYGKPYAGALTYTPWSSSGNDSRMQRALPKFVPPHLAPARSPEPRYAPPLLPPPGPQHGRSVSQPRLGFARGGGPSYYVMSPLSDPYDRMPPVPGAIPVEPGDPRMGGRLCLRCGGEGVRMVMLLDLVTCEACGGAGRVWM